MSTPGHRAPAPALRVRPSVCLLYGAFTPVLALLVLPALAPGHRAGTYWATGTAVSVLLLLSVLLHELAHSAAARHYGIGVREVGLSAGGGTTVLARVPDNPRQELLISAAGPAATLLLGLLFWLAAGIAHALGAQLPLSTGLLLLGAVNTVFTAANLLPGADLDGGQVLAALLWWRLGDHKRAHHLVTTIGGVLGAVFLVAGVFLLLTGFPRLGLLSLAVTWLLGESALRRRFSGRLPGARSARPAPPR
ncbi:Zn-dependent protease [Crossiella equi]|uniref:Zn-dependent protease n=1 Tax=Crossiella equi TaxID=130796 RepID=A0ABS5A6H0_9PSEU|nr:site-2 protease family protein [Crossiella equi]MBP2471827.1 Zn-dependent protease [Crossiella equi]